MTEHSLHALAMAIRYDLTAAQSKLTELIRQVSLLEPESITECPMPGCGYRPAQNMPSLAEHMHTNHDGPLPPHWRDDEDDEPDIGRSVST